MKWIAVATEAPTSHHVGKTLAQILVFWCVFLGLLPWLVWHVEQWLDMPAMEVTSHRLLGSIVFVLASTLGLATGLTMAVRGRGTPLPLCTARRLVIVGPYRVVRNPMAVAGITQGLAVGTFIDSWLVLLYALAGAVLWHLCVRPAEERDLEQRFGDPFQAYREKVPLWLPRLTPWQIERVIGWLLVLGAVAMWSGVDASPRNIVRMVPASVLVALLGVMLVRR